MEVVHWSNSRASGTKSTSIPRAWSIYILNPFSIVRSFDVLEVTVGRRLGGVLSVREVVRRLLREDLVRESRYLFLSLMN